MEFYILRNKEVTFPTSSGFLKGGSLITRISEPFEVEIENTKDEDGTDNENYATQLTTVLVENRWNLTNKDSKTDWNLKAAISLPEPPYPSIMEDVREFRKPEAGNLKVYVDFPNSVGNCLEILHNIFNVKCDDPQNVTVNVTVKDFGLKEKSSSSSPISVSWKAKGLEIEEDYEDYDIQFVYRPLIPEPETGMLLVWRSGQEFCGTFTISVVLSSSAMSLLDYLDVVEQPNNKFETFKNMLEKEICTDLEIVAGVPPDQKIVKCHRAILAAGSKVFKGMFESGMKEATGNRIEIEEMSEEGVRAFLAYLYHKEIKGAYESSEIALELYDIQILKDTVREYMLAKESQWFGVDVVLTLYLFVRKVCSKEKEEIRDEVTREDDDVEMKSNKSDECEDAETEAWKRLKIKCLKVLKWYIKKKPITLLESVRYQEIFGGGNLKLGMEITAGILRLD